jgi:hypothetical protein
LNVTDDHFVSDFFRLNQESSCFEIPAKFSFQDGESVFHELSSWVDAIIELACHFLTVSTPNILIIPRADWDNRVGMKMFSDKPMNRFRIVSFIHDVTIGFPDIMTLSE